MLSLLPDGTKALRRRLLTSLGHKTAVYTLNSLGEIGVALGHSFSQ